MTDAFAMVREELSRARKKHAPMNSIHEGYAVLLEEVDELWDEIKKQDPEPSFVRKEAVHVASMAIRMIEDLLS